MRYTSFQLKSGCLLPVCEEIYLPILEAHLHSEEVDRMVEAMERTVNEAKGRAL